MAGTGIDAHRLLGWVFDERIQDYTERDSILYALSLGFGSDPLDDEELRYVYEKGLVALPTMAVTLGFDGPWSVPGSRIDLTRVLHGEQSLVLHRPLPTAGTVKSRERITGVVDQGEGSDAIVYSRRELVDCTTDALLATLRSSLYCRGGGGCGGSKGQVEPLTQKTPATTPERTIDIQTLPQTSLLYRLNGDLCLLHIDPDFARQAKFPKPIMHGLCTYGITARALAKACVDFTPERLRGMQARFSAPAYPGETLTVEVWREGNIVSFRTWSKERRVKVLDNGRAVVSNRNALRAADE